MMERCAKCHELAPLADLIVVEPIASPHRRFYVHRDSVLPGCFRFETRGASIHRIALADRPRFSTGVPG